MKWTTEKRRLGELIPYEHNPRQLTDKQYADLKASLSKFNLAEIPAVNTDNQLLAGHQRVKIMLELYGIEHEIAVRIPDRKLTEKECQEYNIRSNKNTGEWDFDALANIFEIDDLIEWGFDQKELGVFAVDEINPPHLPNIEQSPFQQITFTLHHTQADIIKQALTKSKASGDIISSVNENSNGNAITYIAERYLNGKS